MAFYFIVNTSFEVLMHIVDKTLRNRSQYFNGMRNNGLNFHVKTKPIVQTPDTILSSCYVLVSRF
jgi:hypothetical protein